MPARRGTTQLRAGSACSVPGVEFRNALSARALSGETGRLHRGAWLVDVRVVPVDGPADAPGVWTPGTAVAWREGGVQPFLVHVTWGPLGLTFPAWFARADVRPRNAQEPPP